MADQDMTQLPGRRARDRSMVILLVGVALLMPPIAHAVLMEDRLFGLPVPLLYIFVVWAGLIAGTYILSRRFSEILGPPPGAAADKSAPPPHRSMPADR